MRLSLARCVLVAFLFLLSVVPASAESILVGRFEFLADFNYCEFIGADCKTPGYFSLTNFVDIILEADDPRSALTFSAVILIGGSVDDDWQFIDPIDSSLVPASPIGGGGTLVTNSLAPSPLADGLPSLAFANTNEAELFGLLSLSDVVYEPEALQYSANVLFTRNAVPEAVTEAPSWFVGVLALAAVAAARSWLS